MNVCALFILSGTKSESVARPCRKISSLKKSEKLSRCIRKYFFQSDILVIFAETSW